MEQIVKYIAIVCLGVIIVQDFGTRFISAIPIFLIFSSGIARSFLTTVVSIYPDIVINISMIVIILLVAYGFARLRGKKTFIDSQFGTGDILLLLALAVWFQPMTFIWLFTVSSILALLGSGILRYIFAREDHKIIPFAGWIGIASIISILFDETLTIHIQGLYL